MLEEDKEGSEDEEEAGMMQASVCIPTPTSNMEEGVPTVSVTGVASRFVSQTDIEAARSRREEQWKAAYARFVDVHNPLAFTHPFQTWTRAPSSTH